MTSKKKKILFLSRYQNVVARGAETFVSELSKQLNKDFIVEIITGEDSDNYQKITGSNADWVFPLNGRSQSMKASLGRIKGKYKLIIAGQSGIGRDDIWNIALAKPNIFVALTDHMALWAKKWAWGSDVRKIPNGVDLKKFKQGKKRMFNDLKGPILLSVGALEWYKHHELTIKAVSKLKNVSLVIVGKGSQKEYLEFLAKRYGLEGRFKITSAPFEKLPEIYQSVDLFTLPSWDREAFGIVYVEALASGLGIVAPDDHPRREIVGEAGVLVDVYDSEKFAKAIEKGLKKNWTKEAKLQAEKFSWEKLGKEYAKIFDES